MRRRTLLKSLATAPAAAALHAQTPGRTVPPNQTSASVTEDPKLQVVVPDAAAEPVIRFFTAEQFAALAHLADILEPAANQIPGARVARAPEFLDFLLSRSPALRQTLYRNGLDLLNQAAMSRYKQPFAALDAPQSAAILEPLRRPWTHEESADPLERFLRAAKDDLLQATRNSYEFISVMSKRSRSASGIGEYWYPLA